MSVEHEVTSASLLMLEYGSVKDEQRARIGFRDNLLYATIASTGAVVVGALRSGNHAATLLLLPPVSVVLGWTYLVNDEKISAIGRYVRAEIGPRLSALSADQAPVLGWELAHRADSGRRSRKFLQLGVDLLAFCLAPVAALVAYWIADPSGGLLIATSAVEAVAVAVLGAQTVLYADLKGN